MNAKRGMAALAVLTAALAAVFLLLSWQEDTEPPEIQYEDTVPSYDGTDPDSLLADVTAWDRQDGDVTDSLKVAKIYGQENDEGVVVYTAKDSSNNVAMERREIHLEAGALENGGWNGSADGTDGTGTGQTGSGNDGTGAGQNGPGNDGTGAGQSGENTDPGEHGNAGDEEDPEGTEISPDGIHDTLGNLTEEAYEDFRETQLTEGGPVVRLTEHRITLEAGERFNIYNYIDEVEDDRDTINTMLRMDEGDLDTDTPGTYVVTLYAQDSDGNTSNIEYIEVTVQ